MDKETRNHYEQKLGDPNELPEPEELLDFLQLRERTLDANPYVSSKNNQQVKKSSNIVNIQKTCVACDNEHMLFMCPEFLAIAEDDRRDLVKFRNLCYNCLRQEHSVKECKVRTSCKVCGRRHNTLIHPQPRGKPKETQATFVEGKSLVLLATAVIKVKAKN